MNVKNEITIHVFLNILTTKALYLDFKEIIYISVSYFDSLTLFQTIFRDFKGIPLLKSKAWDFFSLKAMKIPRPPYLSKKNLQPYLFYNRGLCDLREEGLQLCIVLGEDGSGGNLADDHFVGLAPILRLRK